MSSAIQVENLSKIYQLGQFGTKTLSKDVERWWVTKVMGKEDPFLKIGEVNTRDSKSSQDWVYSLKDINFEIEQGDAVGVIGRNGAGKSTLLKILSRVTSPTTGRVNIKGRVASLLEVGTGFHPELTGRENIYLNGAILGMRKKEIDRTFDAIVDFSGVERYIDTPVKRYSSGMYVRLAFAVAAHLESEILIVDEVLAVGDADFQKKCLGKMGAISKGEGRTVLFVSHSMASIIALCRKSILLQNGSIAALGETGTIVNRYINLSGIGKSEYMEHEIILNQAYEWAKFKTIRTSGNSGITNSFSINEEIKIEIEYEVLRDNEIIHPSIHLLDNLGTTILATFNGTSANLNKDPFFSMPLSKGNYKSICSIPAFFLNDANYKVSCFLVPENASKMAIAKEILLFSVSETGEMRQEFHGGWVGLIRPRMAWMTSKL